MAKTKKCPKCRCSYSSITHAKKCRGLSGTSLRQLRNRRNRSQRKSRSTPGRGIWFFGVANGDYHAEANAKNAAKDEPKEQPA